MLCNIVLILTISCTNAKTVYLSIPLGRPDLTAAKALEIFRKSDKSLGKTLEARGCKLDHVEAVDVPPTNCDKLRGGMDDAL